MESHPYGKPHMPHPTPSQSAARPAAPATPTSVNPAARSTPYKESDGYYRISPAPPRPPFTPATAATAPTPIQLSQAAKSVTSSFTTVDPMPNGGKGIPNNGKGGATSATTVIDGPTSGSGAMEISGGDQIKVPGNGIQSIKLRLGGVGAGKGGTAEGVEKREAMSQPRPKPQSTTPLNSPPRHVAAMARAPPPGAIHPQHQHTGSHSIHQTPFGSIANAARQPVSARVPVMPVQEAQPSSDLRMTSSGSGSGSGSGSAIGNASTHNIQRSDPRRATPSRPIVPARPVPNPNTTSTLAGDDAPLRYTPLHDTTSSLSSRPKDPPSLLPSSSSRHNKPPPTPLPSSRQAQPPLDPEGDSIMREAAEGLVQEQRRSLRGRAARSGAALDGSGGRDAGGGGSEMSVIAGVSASGKGVKIGGAVKIGTGPGGVQRKKKKGDIDVPNQDFCSVCRGVGRFLCCDGCPRSFHFMCLDPPLRVDELPEEETWYCKKCRQDMGDEPSTSTPTPSTSRPPLKPIPAAFRMMIKRLDEDNPTQFRLPTDVRTYFAGVGSDMHDNYVEEQEAGRRKGQEDRDPFRIKDSRSRPVACYVCGGSSIPVRSLMTDPDPSWRLIASCDYCALHWHLDCLTPPLSTVPNLYGGRKWMCPNHAEQVMTRRRTVRTGLETVDIKQPNTPNNGNIIVVPNSPKRPRLEYEDIMVNKRKYRVPERIIQLDFLDRIKGKGPRSTHQPKKRPRRSGSESSLTSLGSEDEPQITSPADLDAAKLIMGLASGKTATSTSTNKGHFASASATAAPADPSGGVSTENTTPEDDIMMADSETPQELARTEVGHSGDQASSSSKVPSNPMDILMRNAGQSHSTALTTLSEAQQSSTSSHPVPPTFGPGSIAAPSATTNSTRPEPVITSTSTSSVITSVPPQAPSQAVTADIGTLHTSRAIERSAPAATISLDTARAIADGYRNGFARD